MKTKLLFTKQNSHTLCILLVFCLCFNYGWSQNLMLNGSCDEHTFSTGDNADAYDITPNNEINEEGTGTLIPSPYNAIWDNDPLQDYIEGLYNGGGNLDEQPGSTSDGAGNTRGMKLYNDGDPVAQTPGVCTRRIYQKVLGLTIGNDYIFSVDSRTRSNDIPSEVFILNEEITTEVGLENGATDPRVDAFLNITNDFNTDGDIFVTNTLSFTATNTFAVVYIRALNAYDGSDHQAYYDNFSLILDPAMSVDDVLASKFKIYPNPANDFITIESNNQPISSVQIFSLLGKQVYLNNELKSNQIDVSNLSQGVYMLKLNAEGNSVTKKLIIE